MMMMMFALVDKSIRKSLTKNFFVCVRSRWRRQFASSTNIAVIGLPYWYGQRKLGTNLAPDVLRANGLITKLNSVIKSVHHPRNNLIDFGDIHLDPQSSNDIQCFQTKPEADLNPNELNLWRLCRKSSSIIQDLIQNDCIPLILGGDHSVVVGSVLGSYRATQKLDKELSLIWIDAHADANTVQNSRSGNLHGMPISFMVKSNDDPEADYIADSKHKIQPFISAKNIVYIGLRDVESQELKLLKALGIHYFTMKDVDNHGIVEVLARSMALVDPLSQNKIHISFDVDSLDPSIIPSTGTPVLGGLTLREAFCLGEHLHKSGRICALDVVEFNPKIGTKIQAEQSAKIIIEIILMFFGKSRIGYYSTQSE